MELTNAIGEYGILIVIASLFLINTIADRKKVDLREEKNNQTLQLLTKAIDSVAKSLDLLKQSNENTAEIFIKHDERSIRIDDKLTEIKTIVSGCQKKGR